MNQMTTTTASTPNISRTAKDALARLMASENIRVQHSASASTAMFDVVNRVLILPVWEEMSHDLYDMLVTHEVGHALFTPSDPQVVEVAVDYIAGASKQGQMIAKQFLNIIEDARIERMMKDKFPGSRRSFYRAYSELHARNFFGMDKQEDINNANLADRINLFFKGELMGLATVPFNITEQTFVDRAKEVDSFDEVIEIAADLYEHMKMDDDQNQDDNQDGESQSGEMSDEDGDDYGDFGDADSADGESGTQVGSSDAGDEDDADENGESSSAINAESGDEDADETAGEGAGEDASDAKGDGTMDSDGEAPEDDGSTAESNKTDQSQEASSGDAQDGGEAKGSIPQGSETERSFADSVKDLNNTNADQYYYHDAPTVIGDEVVVDYKEINRQFAGDIRSQTDWNGAELFTNFERNNRTVVNNMAKQFEMKKAADADRRTQIGKSGKIDMTRVFSYQYNEDIFLRNETTPDGKNHGMVMFVDWSGSMCDCLSDTIEQVMCLALFCKKVNIPFEVYGFSSCYYDSTIKQSSSRWDRQRSATPRQICKEYTPVIAESDSDCGWYKKGDVTKYDTHDYLDVRDFTLMNLLSSRANRLEWKEQAENLLVVAQQCGNRYRRYDNNAPRLSVPSGMNLGGTPLNEAILAACTIVPEFRAKNNLQVVNTVFLTDGQASSMNGGYGGKNVIRNPKTGQEASADKGRRSGMTESLLNYFRQQSGGRAIGMFLASAKSKQQFARLAHGFMEANFVYNDLDNLHADWKKNHFFTSAQDGYDEYFVIDSGQNTETLDLDSLGDDVSFTKLRNTFAKQMTGRQMSRVLLNRFVELVATDLS